MAEGKKIKIAIASVLKPVHDTRMFEKIAKSLDETGHYEVHVIGFPGVIPSTKVKIHTFKPFKRLSFQRLIAPWRILFKTLDIRPELLIITTHELLWMSVVAKVFTSCRLIYDVQENYFLNIFYTNAFPSFLRPFLAIYVRMKEVLLSVFVNHFLLAEISYAKELTFTKSNHTVIENKVILNSVSGDRYLKKDEIVLLFTGTLAENTGVFTAIEMALKLHDLDPTVRLKIIGYCSTQEVLYKIINTIEPYDFISITGGDKHVPHDHIMKEILSADFGIISYQINPSTSNSIPTKLYEYLGGQLPIILVNYKPWVEICTPFNAALVFESTNLDAKNIYSRMKSSKFYSKRPTHVLWENEVPKLIRAVSRANRE